MSQGYLVVGSSSAAFFFSTATAGVKRELLETSKAKNLKEASILWSHHEEQASCLEKEIMQGTMPGARR